MKKLVKKAVFVNHTNYKRELLETSDGYITDGVIAVRAEFLDLKTSELAKVRKIDTCVKQFIKDEMDYNVACKTSIILEMFVEIKPKKKTTLQEYRLVETPDSQFICINRTAFDQLEKSGFDIIRTEKVDPEISPIVFSCTDFGDAVVMPVALKKINGETRLCEIKENTLTACGGAQGE